MWRNFVQAQPKITHVPLDLAGAQRPEEIRCLPPPLLRNPADKEREKWVSQGRSPQQSSEAEEASRMGIVHCFPKFSPKENERVQIRGRNPGLK